MNYRDIIDPAYLDRAEGRLANMQLGDERYFGSSEPKILVSGGEAHSPPVPMMDQRSSTWKPSGEFAKAVCRICQRPFLKDTRKQTVCQSENCKAAAKRQHDRRAAAARPGWPAGRRGPPGSG